MAYSEDEIESVFESICREIELGSSLRSALKTIGSPSSNVFYEWIDGNELKNKRYARACEERANAIFEDTLDIADDKSGDVLKNENGDEYLNQEFVQRAKLKIDTRKWMLGKMNPKKYGDKNTTVLEGGLTNKNVVLSPEEYAIIKAKKESEI